MRLSHAFGLSMLLLLVVCLVQPTTHAANKATKTSAVQSKVNFNNPQSLGDLYLYDIDQRPKWNAKVITDGANLGPAKGTVNISISGSKRLGLNLNRRAFDHPELLDKITPNIIEGLVMQASSVAEGEEEDQRITNVIPHLGNFAKLKELFVDRSDTSDGQISRLPVLKSLERFSAYSDPLVYGTCLKHLSQFPNLRSVNLWLTSLNGENLVLLKDLKNLECLDLAQTNLQGKLKYLPECPSVKELDISSTRINDDDLKYLLRFKNLERLDADNCKISDKGLPILAKLKKLKVLDIQCTGVTISGITDSVKDMHLDRLLVTDRHFTAREQQQLKAYCPCVYFGSSQKVMIPSKEIQRIFAPISRHAGF